MSAFSFVHRCVLTCQVVGLHTFMALPTQDVNDGTEIKKAFESLDTEFNMLIKARKDALCAQEESLVQVGHRVIVTC